MPMVTLKPTSLSKKIFKAIEDLVENATFKFSSKGLNLVAFSSDIDIEGGIVVEMLSLEHYSWKGIDDISFTTDIYTIFNIFDFAQDDDIITLTPVRDSHLIISIKSNNSARVIGIKMKVMDSMCLDISNQCPPHDAIVTMPSSIFARICKDCSINSDTVEISVTKDKVTFSANSHSGSVVTTLGKSEKATTADVIEIKRPVVLVVASPTCLQKVTNAVAPLSNTVTLRLSSIHMMVEYKIGEMNYIKFCLSPKADKS